MGVLLKNNATSRLASSLTAGATTLSVTSGDGAKFPSPTAEQWFPLTVIKASGTLEIMRCTARSGDLLTVVRAQEGTAAQAFTAGDRVELRLTAGALAEFKQTDTISAFMQGMLDDADAAEARTTLGLGTAATRNTGQSGGAVPLLNQVNTWSHPQYIAGQSANPTPLFIERASGANVSVAFRLGSTGEYTYIGMGPNTPGELYIGTEPDLQGEGKRIFHTGNISTASVAHATTATTALNAPGVGQAWKNLTESRALGVTYTNSTGKLIFVSVSIEGTGSFGGRLRVYTSGTGRGFSSANSGGVTNVCVPVGPGETYGAEILNGSGSLFNWSEYR